MAELIFVTVNYRSNQFFKLSSGIFKLWLGYMFYAIIYNVYINYIRVSCVGYTPRAWDPRSLVFWSFRIMRVAWKGIALH